MLLVFEGVDGVGKSTQIALLSKFLTQEGYKVNVLRDLTPANKTYFATLDNRSRIHFVTEQRRANVTLVNTFIAAYQLVIYDRYIDSTVAYQGHGILSRNLIYRLHTHRVGLIPDLTLTLDYPFGLPLKHRVNSGKWDALDEQCVKNYQKIRGMFLDYTLSRDRVIIQADNSINVVHNDIIDCVVSNKKFLLLKKIRQAFK